MMNSPDSSVAPVVDVDISAPGPVYPGSGGYDASSDADNNEDPPQSLFENIIPYDNLKKGWFTLTTAFMETAAEAQKKATDAYNSEQFTSLRTKTAEIVTPAWEKTCEVAAPIWEKTKNSAEVAAEKMRPTLEKGWERVSEAVVTAQEYTIIQVEQLAQRFNGDESAPGGDSSSGEGGQYPASAMDTATRGGPMTL
jgi:hypothetical protein